ncbi:SRPBCC family protein [Georgenia faecalis]|uniref:SRPBCC family protein n=1 Tax=Georgenia faecalis TaxID=2483799 RepID=A0ABV9D5P8_9MICO|nr:SRPBCC family protein [Georgenia faecalis]
MVTVVRSRRIAAPAAKIWAVIGDFGDPSWILPPDAPVPPPEFDGDPHVPGTRRIVELPDGTRLVEQLVHRDPVRHRLRYSIVDSPLEFRNHEAEIAIDGDDERSTVTWTATFEATPASAAFLEVLMGDQNFTPALDALVRLVQAG